MLGEEGRWYGSGKEEGRVREPTGQGQGPEGLGSRWVCGREYSDRKAEVWGKGRWL